MRKVRLAMFIRNGSLKFWGDWFGRPYDNFHTVIRATVSEDNVLTILFDQGEVVEISKPTKIISEKDKFYIPDASNIRFSWYYYGRDRIAQNLNYLEYSSQPNGSVIRKDQNGFQLN